MIFWKSGPSLTKTRNDATALVLITCDMIYWWLTVWQHSLVVVQAKMRFVELVYVLATEEAERIGVDHVARVSAGDSREGSMGKNCFIVQSAL